MVRHYLESYQLGLALGGDGHEDRLPAVAPRTHTRRRYLGYQTTGYWQEATMFRALRATRAGTGDRIRQADIESMYSLVRRTRWPPSLPTPEGAGFPATFR